MQKGKKSGFVVSKMQIEANNLSKIFPNQLKGLRSKITFFSRFGFS
jgi:hypothetical protein